MTEPFHAGPMLEALNRHQVQYVVIGGYAAQIHGASRPTHPQLQAFGPNPLPGYCSIAAGSVVTNTGR